MLKKKPNSNIGDREAFFSPRFFIFSGGICSANLPSSHTKDERKRLLLLQRWIEDVYGRTFYYTLDI